MEPNSERAILDTSALVLYFPTPASSTGEDVLELHVHGGPATVRAVLNAIPRCLPDHPARYAEPGEFARRAFCNGRLDLAQVEALGNTLAAETEQQRRVAVRGGSRALVRTYEDWRNQLVEARGELEALIDFFEDHALPESQTELIKRVTDRVTVILTTMSRHEDAGRRGELLRGGIRVALLGPPNVGKSSLMNRIVGREASIVSSEAGTTRDIVDVTLDLRGYFCLVSDTAGIRTELESSLREGGNVGEVEQEGIRRARMRAEESDVVIALSSFEGSGSNVQIYYEPDTLQLAAAAPACLFVVNKSDSVDCATRNQILESFRSTVLQKFPGLANAETLSISCVAGSTLHSNPVDLLDGKPTDPGNIGLLAERLTTCFAGLTAVPPALRDMLGTTERQRLLLAECQHFLRSFLHEAAPDRVDVVLAAEYLRFAAECLARITGRGGNSDVEEILGVVFEKSVRKVLLPHHDACPQQPLHMTDYFHQILCGKVKTMEDGKAGKTFATTT